MKSFKSHLDEKEENHEQLVQNSLFGANDYSPFHDEMIIEGVETHPSNSKRLVFREQGSGTKQTKRATGIVVPKHMWYGAAKTVGMEKRNELRAKVYGSENRDPLGLGQIEKIHKEVLGNHFQKSKAEQIRAEKAAIAKLKSAGHLDSEDTTDPGDKTDTVKHEFDEEGRPFVAVSSKGVAGHALYTSGHGENAKHHILNTCPAQTTGCGGGVDHRGLADTSKGTCFAPKAEAQYPNAAVRRASHAQAKHDPAMTSDWILAHTHSLRRQAEKADKPKAHAPKGERFLFRPNVVDETDRSSRHVIKHLNKQRVSEGKPSIIANSYGKTNELHDPENGYHVTYSNTGPKVKHGASIAENIRKDRNRIRQTIHATDISGDHIVNDEGKKVPPKNSYVVSNVKRGSDLDKDFQKHVTHAKYWSEGREKHELSDDEVNEGDEGHFDGSGKKTTPEKAHYGHITVNGRRYDYQKQHVLHPRLVDVNGHMIPTDSRFKDNEHLPKNRFKSKNGKDAGALLITTPTESTSYAQHHSSFTHHIGPEHVEHAKTHGGEYEIDNPHDQEAARGREYAPPNPIQIRKKV